MEQICQKTGQRRQELQDQGYQVIEMWEHEHDRRWNTDKEFRQKAESYDVVEIKPLNPRDCLYGGRTNATRLLYDVGESKREQIKYIDVCSLYPWVCKYQMFPTGHPEIRTDHLDANYVRQYEGLIKCQVLPPTDLYQPVLSYHCQGKLIFPLC